MQVCQSVYKSSGGDLTLTKSCEEKAECESNMDAVGPANACNNPFTAEKTCVYCCTGDFCNVDPAGVQPKHFG